MPQSPDTVDGYLAALPEDQRAALEKLRATIKATAPEAAESISYGIPTFKYKGRPLIYFGAAKKHCAIYGMSVMGAFEEKLQPYDRSKGTIRFPAGKPIPAPLVKEMWFFSGDREFTMPSGTMTLKLSPASAEAVADIFRATGAIVLGRRMFEVANGWGGRHPIDIPVFVVTHTVPQEWVKEGSPFTFVTDGVASAVAQAKRAAGEKIVGVGGANVAQQCLELGLLDEIYVQLVPVLLGGGVRLFDHLAAAPELETTRVVDAPGVTHLTYRVVKEGSARTRHHPFEAPAKA
jgi:uncharacterized protein YdhG (YjbR/CyaY superfamily)/dihydrofolate reductase